MEEAPAAFSTALEGVLPTLALASPASTRENVANAMEHWKAPINRSSPSIANLVRMNCGEGASSVLDQN